MPPRQARPRARACARRWNSSGYYPVLPWIGVILLGWVAGPLFSPSLDGRGRQRILVGLGVACRIVLLAVFGPNQGSRFGVAPDQFWVVWVVSVALVLALYPLTRAFARYKRRTTLAWVKYF
ncbi:MAG: heparan-alpha-glucosaminide N-acetyltransferase domain-containing protein [Pseudomonas sp.]